MLLQLSAPCLKTEGAPANVHLDFSKSGGLQALWERTRIGDRHRASEVD
jgi:hypothetical protein